MNVIKRLFFNLARLFKLSSSKLLVLLVILLVGGLMVGCAPTTQPRGWSGGVLADGKLFLGSMEGKLVALNASGGAQFWSTTLETTKQGSSFGCAAPPSSVAIYGTPAVFEDLVYVGGYNGRISAFNADSGALRWVYPREGNLEPIVGGLIVALGRVYFGCSDGKVYALDAPTGDKIWDFPTGNKVWATPTIDGNTLFIGSFDKKLYAIDATTGKGKWENPFETQEQGAIVSTPLVYNNAVYFGSFDRYFYAVDATDGHLRWRSEVEAGRLFWAKPIIYNGTVYAPCLDGKVYILSAETGHEVADAIDLGSPISSSPVLIDDAVIVATEAGKVYSLDTKTNESKLLAELKQKILAPLFASDGTVYVHTQEHETLYALDAQTGAQQWSVGLTSK